MSRQIIAAAKILRATHLLPGQKVMLDFDLAHLYGVTTGNSNKAVARNAARFPRDFMFRLQRSKWNDLIFQIGISKSRGGRRHLPFACTEEGVAMLSSVPRSERAVKVNISIMRAFVQLRGALETNRELAQKFGELERRVGKHDHEIGAIVEAIRRLMAPPAKAKPEIGFYVRETPLRYGTRKGR